MKKQIAVLLILTMLIPAASLADMDFNSMTDQELKEIMTSCSDILRNRQTIPDDWVLLFDEENIQIYQIGEARLGSSKILTVPAAVINKNDFYIHIYIMNSSCNGWVIDSSSRIIPNDSKEKWEINFFLDDAFIENIDDIVSLKFKWLIESDDKKVFTQDTAEEYRFW